MITVIEPVKTIVIPWGNGIAVVTQYVLEKGKKYIIQETLGGNIWTETGSTQPQGNGTVNWSMFAAIEILAPYARLVLNS